MVLFDFVVPEGTAATSKMPRSIMVTIFHCFVFMDSVLSCLMFTALDDVDGCFETHPGNCC